MEYHLDLHCTMLLESYRELQPVYIRLEQVLRQLLQRLTSDAGLYVTAIECRVKTEASLVGKLERKGGKYSDINDITDIVGARVITFYDEDIDKVAAFAEQIFNVDRDNSVDKRRREQLYTFGYESLHYICSIPRHVYYDPDMPQLNDLRFELQMKTALQHVWATIEHDIGYKKGVEIPREHLRTIGQLSGMLGLADKEFSRIRASVNDYRRRVLENFDDGDFNAVPLDRDTFRKYLDIKPFDSLIQRIARINQAEVMPASSMPFLDELLHLDFKTIGDVEQLVRTYSEAAFQLAGSQLGGTDIDIINESIALQSLLMVYIHAKHLGEAELLYMFRSVSNSKTYTPEWAHQQYAMMNQLSMDN